MGHRRKVYTKNGQVIIENVTITELKDGRGYSTGSVVRLGNVVEHERELYEVVANNSPVGIAIVQDGKFKFVNRQLQIVTGYDELELLEIEPFNIIHPDDLTSTKQSLIDHLKGHSPSGYNLRIITKPGDTAWLHTKVATITYEGKRAMLSNVMDITDHKIIQRDIAEQAQAQDPILKQAQDLSKRLQELHCLYGISKLAQRPGTSLDELIQATVNLIPYAWQYPEITCARVVF